VPLTDAGRRLLQNYLQLEAGQRPEGRWPEVFSTRMVDVLVGGMSARAMVLPAGDGGARAAAKRLEKDGYAIVRWNTERLLIITEAGRAAVSA